MCKNEDAAIIASGSHIVPHFLLSRSHFCQIKEPQRQSLFQNHAIFAIIHTDKTRAQYTTYLNSNFKSHVIASNVESKPNLDHQPKKNWRSFCFQLFAPRRTGKPHQKKIRIDILSQTHTVALDFIHSYFFTFMFENFKLFVCLLYRELYVQFIFERSLQIYIISIVNRCLKNK